MQNVNAKTRASRHGTLIKCPHCGDMCPVGHFSWSALTCGRCEVDVSKHEWLLVGHLTKGGGVDVLRDNNSNDNNDK